MGSLDQLHFENVKSKLKKNFSEAVKDGRLAERLRDVSRSPSPSRRGCNEPVEVSRTQVAAPPSRKTDDWRRVDAALAELTSAVCALRPGASGGLSGPVSKAVSFAPSQPPSVRQAALSAPVYRASSSGPSPLPPPVSTPPTSVAASALPSSASRASQVSAAVSCARSPSAFVADEDLVPAKPRKAHSIFASSHPADQALLARHYVPNIFQCAGEDGIGVHNDASSLQLRVAARLLAREQELRAQESLGTLWQLQREEMCEVDRFLGDFECQEASALPWHLHRQRLASAPRHVSAPWRGSKADYVDELLRANPDGFDAAMHVGMGAAQAERLAQQQRMSGFVHPTMSPRDQFGYGQGFL